MAKLNFSFNNWNRALKFNAEHLYTIFLNPCVGFFSNIFNIFVRTSKNWGKSLKVAEISNFWLLVPQNNINRSFKKIPTQRFWRFMSRCCVQNFSCFGQIMKMNFIFSNFFLKIFLSEMNPQNFKFTLKFSDLSVF